MKWLLFFLVFPFVTIAQNCDDTPELNKKILALADKKMSKKVGTGECWDLAYYVLEETNAEWDEFEVYGALIKYKTDCIFPGDLIQFEKIKLEWEEGDMTYYETMQHHTAIVYEVIDKNLLVLIHQNTGHHGKKVGTSEFRLDAIVKGEIFVYRPVAGN